MKDLHITLTESTPLLHGILGNFGRCGGWVSAARCCRLLLRRRRQEEEASTASAGGGHRLSPVPQPPKASRLPHGAVASPQELPIVLALLPAALHRRPRRRRVHTQDQL